MKPMLAHRYSQRHAKFPAYAQPKLNGVRAIWIPGVSGSTLVSRGRPGEPGIPWLREVLPHIFPALDLLMTKLGQKFLLDGELYCHGLSLQQINRRVAVNRVEAHDDVRAIRFHIFDIPHQSPFSQRALWLSNLDSLVNSDAKLSSGLSVVQTTYINDELEFERYYRLQRNDKFEGAMYRNAHAPYGFANACTNKENRWPTLLKRKAELDLDATIIGIERGTEGKAFEETTGALILQLDNGIEFRSGSGLQVVHRDLILHIIDELVKNKTRVRITYDELSDAGVPLRNRIECIYDPRF